MLVGKDPVSPRPLDARAAWFAEGKAWLACLARKALEFFSHSTASAPCDEEIAELRNRLQHRQ